LIWVYTSAAASVLFIVATYYAFKFAIVILKLQDVLEDSLDVIDEKYASIAAICERPLFYDSPEVRQVLKDIKDTRGSLHQIAIALSKDFEAPEDTKGASNREG
jgi:hypothetical protein